VIRKTAGMIADLASPNAATPAGKLNTPTPTILFTKLNVLVDKVDFPLSAPPFTFDKTLVVTSLLEVPKLLLMFFLLSFCFDGGVSGVDFLGRNVDADDDLASHVWRVSDKMPMVSSKAIEMKRHDEV